MPKEFVEADMCIKCPWFEEVSDPDIYRLVYFLHLQDAGCPLERHELTGSEWLALGEIKVERKRLSLKDSEENREEIEE